MVSKLAPYLFGLALTVGLCPAGARACVAEHMLAGAGQSYQTLLLGKAGERHKAAHHLVSLVPSLDAQWLAAMLGRSARVSAPDIQNLLSRLALDANDTILGKTLAKPNPKHLKILSDAMNGRCKRDQSTRSSLMKLTEQAKSNEGGLSAASQGRGQGLRAMQSLMEEESSGPNKLVMIAVLLLSAGLSYLYFWISYRAGVSEEERYPRRPFKARFQVVMDSEGEVEDRLPAEGIDITIHGMKLALESPPQTPVEPGDHMRLFLATGELGATMVWSRAQFLGIVFDRQLKEGELEALL